MQSGAPKHSSPLGFPGFGAFRCPVDIVSDMGAGRVRCAGPAAGRQRRRRVVTNRSMARVLGMHGEEVLARFAAREAQLPFSELDALRYFVYDLSTSALFIRYLFLSVSLLVLSCLVGRPALLLRPKYVPLISLSLGIPSSCSLPLDLLSSQVHRQVLHTMTTRGMRTKSLRSGRSNCVGAVRVAQSL
jgi:hypothetical protein